MKSANSKLNSCKFAPKMSHSVTFTSSGVVLSLLDDSLRRNKACFEWKRKKLLSIRIAEKPGR